MKSFLLWWIDFWRLKQKLFIFFLILTVGFLVFTAIKINLNENINQVFSDKEISKILTGSESQKVFISINTENSEFEIDEIKEAVLFELSNNNQLTFLTEQEDKSSFLDVFDSHHLPS